MITNKQNYTFFKQMNLQPYSHHTRSVLISPSLRRLKMGRMWCELDCKYNLLARKLYNFVAPKTIRLLIIEFNLDQTSLNRSNDPNKEKWRLREFFGRKSTFFLICVSKDSPCSCDHFHTKLFVVGGRLRRRI